MPWEGDFVQGAGVGSSLLTAGVRTGHECRREPGVPTGWGWWRL